MSQDEPKSKKLKSDTTQNDLVSQFADQRKQTAESILKFKFNKKRVRILTENDEVAPKSQGILYWMFRDERVEDNWALLFAQRLALKYELPLHVCFCILPKFLDATLRHYKFLLGGLKEVDSDLKNLDIQFHLLHGEPNTVVIDFIKKYEIGVLITDFFPLRLPMFWVNDILKKLPKNVAFCQIDAHNVVPCWQASPKQEYGARTIRGKINKLLPEYLTEFPPVIKHPYKSKQKFPKINWETALDNIEVDRNVDEVSWAKPGYRAGIEMLQSFIKERLPLFDEHRNNPLANALSHLSPWFHFGSISTQRVALEVAKYKSKLKRNVDVFLEEAIVRRELGDNFCFYNEHYDSIKGAAEWAQKSLELHKKDKREYLYTLEEFETSQTHDDLWNAAQIQLVKEGKMHGFLRMYWAKKILEWTQSPEEALKFAIYLNDKYSMDGRDPNGYVGCMWSICGIHDQGWMERQVFGKIRFMNYNGCKRKFDVAAFVARYGGKVVTKSKVAEETNTEASKSKKTTKVTKKQKTS